MKKTITPARVTKVIIAVLDSPNRSTERAALWFRLQDLRDKLKNSEINTQALKQANLILNPTCEG